MWFCSGQARAEFTLFARLRSTCGTTNRQRLLRFGFHELHNAPSLANKMVTCDHRAILREAHYLCRRVQGRGLQVVSTISDDSRFLLEPFLRSDPILNQLATNANKSSEPPPTHAGAPSDSERAKQPPLPGPPYKPYAEKPALPEPPYKPYAEKPALPEPYEPYKGM